MELAVWIVLFAAALRLYVRWIIPAIRGTLGMLNDALDLYERWQRITAANPPLPPLERPQQRPTRSQAPSSNPPHRLDPLGGHELR